MWFPAPRLDKMKGQRSLTPAVSYFPIFVASGIAEAQGPIALVPVTPRSFRAVHEGFLLCPTCDTPANASPHSQHHPRSCLHGSLDCPWQQLETLLHPPVGDHWVGSPLRERVQSQLPAAPLSAGLGAHSAQLVAQPYVQVLGYRSSFGPHLTWCRKLFPGWMYPPITPSDSMSHSPQGTPCSLVSQRISPDLRFFERYSLALWVEQHGLLLGLLLAGNPGFSWEPALSQDEGQGPYPCIQVPLIVGRLDRREEQG